MRISRYAAFMDARIQTSMLKAIEDKPMDNRSLQKLSGLDRSRLNQTLNRLKRYGVIRFDADRRGYVLRAVA